MFAHIVHVLMIRLSRYEGVITWGADHKTQDAIHVYIHVYTYCDGNKTYTSNKTGRYGRTARRRTWHGSRRASEDNRSSENAVNPSEQRRISPFLTRARQDNAPR